MTDNNPDLQRIEIRLSKGRFIAFVSPEDAEYVSRFVWSAVTTKYQTYGVRSEKGNNKKKIQLSREIMERMIGRALVKGETVRHKNRDSLDNTRDNLILKGSR
jgi:hypothetical protein